MSNQPENREKNTAPEISEKPSTEIAATESIENNPAPEIVDLTVSPVPWTPLAIGSASSPITETTNKTTAIKTSEKISAPETTEKITAPEAIEKITEANENNPAPHIVDLTVSQPPPNIGLTTALKGTETRNRRFKEPKKLLLSATNQKDGKKEDDEKKDVKKEAMLTLQATRLSNLLKFSPSHSWVWYEFGDSLVDSAIQRGAYEMANFMLEYSPQLKTPFLPRRGWQLLRRNLGKARLFSPAFIEMELKEVNRSRHFVRHLQQAKPVKREEHAFLEQIYRGVSLPLTVNAKVTTFLKGCGIVNGVISRFTPEDSTYVVKCVLDGRATEFTVPDNLIQSLEAFIRLPTAHLMKAIDPHEDIFKMELIAEGKGRYSDQLLEAIVQVKKLLAIKKKAVLELAAKNDSREKAPKPKKGQASFVGVTYAELHRVNTDAVAPMRILNDYLKGHNKKIKLQSVKARTTLERYLKCCHQAEVDIQNVENTFSLNIQLPATRSLYQDLQTILYLTGELGGPNTDDIMIITDNLIAYMIKTLPPELSAQFEITMNELKPLRQRIVEMFKKDANQSSNSGQEPTYKAQDL